MVILNIPTGNHIFHPACTPSDRFPYGISNELRNWSPCSNPLWAQGSIVSALLLPEHHKMSNNCLHLSFRFSLSISIPHIPATVLALLNLPHGSASLPQPLDCRASLMPFSALFHHLVHMVSLGPEASDFRSELGPHSRHRPQGMSGHVYGSERVRRFSVTDSRKKGLLCLPRNTALSPWMD